MKVLEVKDLTKIFKSQKSEFRAVDGVSFALRKGEILGMLGPNGAGKTTTFQMILGLMTPTSGKIEYFGEDLSLKRSQILKRINHVSGYSKLPFRLTVYENLMVFAWLYSVPNKRQKIAEALELFEISDLKSKLFLSLSAGQMTRVLLAKAILNDPEVLLMDEPTASLDPDIADKIRKYLLTLQEEKKVSILITSHNMREVEELCDRVVFLNQGKVLALDTPQGLAKRNQECQLQLMMADGLKRLIKILDQQQLKYQLSQRFISINLKESQINSLLNLMAKQGLEYSEIVINRASLEDFFLSVSKGEI